MHRNPRARRETGTRPPPSRTDRARTRPRRPSTRADFRSTPSGRPARPLHAVRPDHHCAELPRACREPLDGRRRVHARPRRRRRARRRPARLRPQRPRTPARLARGSRGEARSPGPRGGRQTWESSEAPRRHPCSGHAHAGTPLRTTVSTASTFRGDAPTTATERGKRRRAPRARRDSLRTIAGRGAREAHRDPLARRRRVPARQQRRLRDLSGGVSGRMGLARPRRRERRVGLRAGARRHRLPARAQARGRVGSSPRARLERIGTSSFTLREEIHADAGWLAAEAEAVLVARDREAGRSRPLTDVERVALESASSNLTSSS